MTDSRRAGFRGDRYPWWDDPVEIRPAEPADLDRLLELNNAAVPAVNELTADEMAWFLEVAWCSLVAVLSGDGSPGDGSSGDGPAGGEPVALLVGLDGPGLGYASHNYAWFSERYERFLYVDRVVVDPSAFRMGLGRAFYEAFMDRADGHRHLCAEVNTVPRNDRSLAFHDAMGFDAVGEQSDEETGKTVRMYAREL